MYLRKVNGPRVVTMPDGRPLCRADLPDPGTQRWVASRKAKVACAVTHGLIGWSEAKARYALSDEELKAWIRANAADGEAGLKQSKLTGKNRS